MKDRWTQSHLGMSVQIANMSVHTFCNFFHFFPPVSRGMKYVSDSTPVILLTMTFFFLPARKPNIFCWAEDRGKAVSEYHVAISIIQIA